MVVPSNRFQSCEPDGLKRSPVSASMDHLGLVKAVDGFSQSVVVAVADASHRGFDASSRRALGIFDRHIPPSRSASDARRLVSGGRWVLSATPTTTPCAKASL